MRRCLLILLTIYFTSLLNAQENPPSFVLLELFTSQGCSSCPPADKLLDEISSKYSDKNVFVMSYHVDYWNRLGWKDPFSKEEFSDYQREYATKFGSRSIYTPQIVVNGREHFTGSDRGKMTEVLLPSTRSKAVHTIKVQTSIIKNGEIQIQYAISGAALKRVTFALIVARRMTTVSRGENKNRKLINSNIVINRVLQTQAKGKFVMSIPEEIDKIDELSLITYSQNTALEVTGVTTSRLHL